MKNDTKSYSVFFDAKISREESDVLRDAWLSAEKQRPDITEDNMFHRGKNRLVLIQSVKTGSVVIFPHEWGVEYLFTFAGGVAAGIITNAIYDYLKSCIQKYRKKLEEAHPKKYDKMHIDIELDSSNGPIKIAIIHEGNIEYLETKVSIKKVISSIDIERGFK